jgi:hypothetical protein
MKSTGPRTLIGKQRTRLNATKHGIFSSVALLDGESRDEFDSLKEGLEKYYDPRGVLEKILVNMLVILFWRYRRLLIAETAEIQTGIAFPDRNTRHQAPSVVTVRVETDGVHYDNLMHGIADPEYRDKCLGLLADLKTSIGTGGFDTNRDSAILTALYGAHKNSEGRPTLYHQYRAWISKAGCSEEERQKNGFASLEQCKSNFLEEVEEEIRRLERYKAVESDRMKQAALRHYVPGSSQPGHLLRYETSLLRNMDRVLAWLERVQRLRLGHPVPPAIKVNVSSS